MKGPLKVAHSTCLYSLSVPWGLLSVFSLRTSPDPARALSADLPHCRSGRGPLPPRVPRTTTQPRPKPPPPVLRGASPGPPARCGGRQSRLEARDLQRGGHGRCAGRGGGPGGGQDLARRGPGAHAASWSDGHPGDPAALSEQARSRASLRFPQKPNTVPAATMIPPSGAREDSGDGLTREATGTEQPPSPASTSSLESKVQRACTGETQSPFPSDIFPLGSVRVGGEIGLIPRELESAGPFASHAKTAVRTQTFAELLP